MNNSKTSKILHLYKYYKTRKTLRNKYLYTYLSLSGLLEKLLGKESFPPGSTEEINEAESMKYDTCKNKEMPYHV